MQKILLIKYVTDDAREQFLFSKRKKLFVSLPEMHRSLCDESCFGFSINSRTGIFNSVRCDAHGDDLVQMDNNAKLVAIVDR